MKLTAKDIDELERLLHVASDREWRIAVTDGVGKVEIFNDAGANQGLHIKEAKFVAKARNLAQDLIDDWRAMRKVVDEARAFVKAYDITFHTSHGLVMGHKTFSEGDLCAEMKAAIAAFDGKDANEKE